MTIVYCDFITGDDGTGDGSAGNPYKTITTASTGLTGGDEVRVAKSPADTALTGTLGFTVGSTAVTGSGTLFTSELAIGDFVKGGDGQYYEIVTITDNTNAILFKVYPSSTGAGVTGYKLGITSTGEAAAVSTAIQTVSSSGSSAVSRLKISGGWDLTGPTQDGQTYFRQMHGTFTYRYGRGLYASGKDYIEVDHLHFLRYDNCVYMTSCDWWKITSVNLLSAGDEAFYLISSTNNEIITPIVNSSKSKGIYMKTDSTNNTITTPICNSNSTYGILIQSPDNTVTGATCNYNLYGISISTNNNTITSPTCNYNTNYGIYVSSAAYCTITTPTCNYNSWGIYLGGVNTTISTPTCNNNSTYGLVIGFTNNVVTSPTCNDNPTGIWFNVNSANNIVVSAICNNNSIYGVNSTKNSSNIINGFSGTGNTADINTAQGEHFGEFQCLKIQHLNAAGANKCFYEYGITERDTTDARSTQCLKYDPTSAIYYISQSFFFKADSGVAQTLSAYVKDDASFNGDIQAAIYFMGEKITGWTEWIPTTSYVQKSIVAASGDITEDGVLELHIKVRGTAGNVFVDDLATA